MAKEILTFWDNTHPLSAQNEALNDALVPMQGPCETLQGELLRSATKINYDWFNNGWGCNNWSGAVRCLDMFFQFLPVQPSAERIAELKKSLARVYQFSHGENVTISDRSATNHVTKILEIVVEALLANPKPIQNSTDWLTLNERHSRY